MFPTDQQHLMFPLPEALAVKHRLSGIADDTIDPDHLEFLRFSREHLNCGADRFHCDIATLPPRSPITPQSLSLDSPTQSPADWLYSIDSSLEPVDDPLAYDSEESDDEEDVDDMEGHDQDSTSDVSMDDDHEGLPHRRSTTAPTRTRTQGPPKGDPPPYPPRPKLGSVPIVPHSCSIPRFCKICYMQGVAGQSLCEHLNRKYRCLVCYDMGRNVTGICEHRKDKTTCRYCRLGIAMSAVDADDSYEPPKAEPSPPPPRAPPKPATVPRKSRKSIMSSKHGALFVELSDLCFHRRKRTVCKDCNSTDGQAATAAPEQQPPVAAPPDQKLPEPLPPLPPPPSESFVADPDHSCKNKRYCRHCKILGHGGQDLCEHLIRKRLCFYCFEEGKQPADVCVHRKVKFKCKICLRKGRDEVVVLRKRKDFNNDDEGERQDLTEDSPNKKIKYDDESHVDARPGDDDDEIDLPPLPPPPSESFVADPDHSCKNKRYCRHCKILGHGGQDLCEHLIRKRLCFYCFEEGKQPPDVCVHRKVKFKCKICLRKGRDELVVLRKRKDVNNDDEVERQDVTEDSRNKKIKYDEESHVDAAQPGDDDDMDATPTLENIPADRLDHVCNTKRRFCKTCKVNGTGGASLCDHFRRARQCVLCFDAGVPVADICRHRSPKYSCHRCRVEGKDGIAFTYDPRARKETIAEIRALAVSAGVDVRAVKVTNVTSSSAPAPAKPQDASVPKQQEPTRQPIAYSHLDVYNLPVIEQKIPIGPHTCETGDIRYCKRCRAERNGGGASLCDHLYMKHLCPDCWDLGRNVSGLCRHRKRKAVCKECKGGVDLSFGNEVRRSNPQNGITKPIKLEPERDLDGDHVIVDAGDSQKVGGMSPPEIQGENVSIEANAAASPAELVLLPGTPPPHECKKNYCRTCRIYGVGGSGLCEHLCKRSRCLSCFDIGRETREICEHRRQRPQCGICKTLGLSGKQVFGPGERSAALRSKMAVANGNAPVINDGVAKPAAAAVEKPTAVAVEKLSARQVVSMLTTPHISPPSSASKQASRATQLNQPVVKPVTKFVLKPGPPPEHPCKDYWCVVCRMHGVGGRGICDHLRRRNRCGECMRPPVSVPLPVPAPVPPPAKEEECDEKLCHHGRFLGKCLLCKEEMKRNGLQAAGVLLRSAARRASMEVESASTEGSGEDGDSSDGSSSSSSSSSPSSSSGSSNSGSDSEVESTALELSKHGPAVHETGTLGASADGRPSQPPFFGPYLYPPQRRRFQVVETWSASSTMKPIHQVVRNGGNIVSRGRGLVKDSLDPLRELRIVATRLACEGDILDVAGAVI